MRADEVGRIVHRMLEEQVRQGNPRDPEVFVTMLTADLEQGGFLWSRSLEGLSYWGSVMSREGDEKRLLRSVFKAMAEIETAQETPQEIIDIDN